jgi:hypothetical protein
MYYFMYISISVNIHINARLCNIHSLQFLQVGVMFQLICHPQGLGWLEYVCKLLLSHILSSCEKVM